MNINNQNPYWPELPVLTSGPYSNNGQPCYNDHSSIRKLLIKLGGRFSDDHDDYNYNQPFIPDGTGPPHIPSSDPQPQPALGSSTPQFVPQVQLYNNTGHGLADPQMLMQAGQSSSSTSQLAEVDHHHQESGIYNNVPDGQVLDGLEFLYGEDGIGSTGKIGSILNSTTTTYGTADIGWGEMSSIVYNSTTTAPSFVSDYCLF